MTVSFVPAQFISYFVYITWLVKKGNATAEKLLPLRRRTAVACRTIHAPLAPRPLPGCIASRTLAHADDDLAPHVPALHQSHRLARPVQR